MRPPYSPEQFFGAFAAYNLGIWPMQVVAYLLALVALAFVLRPSRYSDRAVGAVLAGLWLWVGAVLHIAYFTSLGPAFYLFGAFFLVEGALLLAVGVLRPRLAFRVRADWLSALGGLLVVYAMLVYPIVGQLTGHVYPSAPVFGVAPCPLVIFTFGLFLWTDARLPRHLLVVPAFWALLGSNAVLPPFSIYQDVGLLLSALAASPLLIWRVGKRGQRGKLQQAYA